MLNLTELEQLAAFARLGTLSQVAEEMHISQPTLTRNMQHIEEAFGAALFVRSRNRIALNETGRLAADYAEKLLRSASDAISAVQDFDKRLHTITVESCAPAPLWSFLPGLSARHPQNVVSSKISELEDIVENVKNGQCDIGILPYAYDGEELEDISYIREKLSVCIPKGHALAAYDELSMAQLNGFNCLLRDELGFWSKLCYDKMPASKFLVQTNEFDMEELIRTSTLFNFTTNLAKVDANLTENRKIIPLTDAQADVTYHLICRPEHAGLCSPEIYDSRNEA